jgi:hypothetical protein
LFYSAQWKENPANEVENFRIGVAVADKPTGPFVDMTDKPIFDPGYPIIDANVFFDTDGRSYLYYSRAAYKHPVKSEIADWARKRGWYKEIEESWVYGVELKARLFRRCRQTGAAAAAAGAPQRQAGRVGKPVCNGTRGGPPLDGRLRYV